MTQRKSFFTSWLWDFWLRIFGKKYETKAGGKSPSTHNWRKCPKCRKRIWTLSFNSSPEKCSHCDAILGFVKATEFCSCGATAQMTCVDAYCKNCKKELLPSAMEFKDGRKRVFTLLKPLYNPLILIWTTLTIISVIFLGYSYDFIDAPVGFYNNFVDSIIWAVIVFNVMLIGMYSLTTAPSSHPIFLTARVIFILVAFCSMLVPIYNNITIIPIWREVPTEASWKLKQETILGKMPPSIERFEMATRIKDFNARPYFVEAARIDFVGLMQEHSAFVQELDPYYGAEFYALVQEHLESLDFDTLAMQCSDPWNIIHTPMSVTRFSSNIDACSVFLH